MHFGVLNFMWSHVSPDMSMRCCQYSVVSWQIYCLFLAFNEAKLLIRWFCVWFGRKNSISGAKHEPWLLLNHLINILIVCGHPAIDRLINLIRS